MSETERFHRVTQSAITLVPPVATCECDYDAQGDPLEYVKTSHYCPLHDTCDALGVKKDMGDLWMNGWRKGQPAWVCQRCSEACPECGNHAPTEGHGSRCSNHPDNVAEREATGRRERAESGQADHAVNNYKVEMGL